MNYKLNGIISKIRSKQTNQNENINKTYTTYLLEHIFL